jgi:endonuclease/exonuclease/phosphatase family metal-dependent hydrolase
MKLHTRKSNFMLSSLSILLLLLTCLATAATHADETSIKVATYNIRYANPQDGDDIWANRADAVIGYAKTNDIVGMQEVTGPQFKQLREALTEFGSYGVGRDDGKDGGEHAPIFYRLDRFEPLEKGTFWLSEAPEAVGKPGWDAALPRTCTWIRLRDIQSGGQLYVANTHFDHRGVEARNESGKLIASRVGSLPADLPIVVMGDFNTLPGSDPYKAIAASMADAREASRSPATGPESTWNGFRQIVPERIIDHIFVRSVEVLRVSIDDPKTDGGRFASDHLPVQVILEIYGDHH